MSRKQLCFKPSLALNEKRICLSSIGALPEIQSTNAIEIQSISPENTTEATEQATSEPTMYMPMETPFPWSIRPTQADPTNPDSHSTGTKTTSARPQMNSMPINLAPMNVAQSMPQPEMLFAPSHSRASKAPALKEDEIEKSSDEKTNKTDSQKELLPDDTDLNPMLSPLLELPTMPDEGQDSSQARLQNPQPDQLPPDSFMEACASFQHNLETALEKVGIHNQIIIQSEIPLKPRIL